MNQMPDLARRDALLDAARYYDEQATRSEAAGRRLDARTWSRAAFRARQEAETFAADAGPHDDRVGVRDSHEGSAATKS